MSTEIKGLLILNEISTDDGSTWDTIVCEDNSQISHTASATETKTKCANFSSTAKEATKITGSGVAVGDMSASEVSFQDLAILCENETKIMMRRQNAATGTIAAGEISYFKGYGYITEATETSNVDGVTTFNWGFTSTGVKDLNPAS